MRNLLFSITMFCFFTGSCFAGVEFKNECKNYSGSSYTTQKRVGRISALKINNEYYPVTVAIGPYNYSISRHNDKVYQVAMVAYLFGRTVNICTKKTNRGNIVELLGIDMV